MNRAKLNNYVYDTPYATHKITPVSELTTSDRLGLEIANRSALSSAFSRDKVGSCLQCE
jgi:hypothetical protein